MIEFRFINDLKLFIAFDLVRALYMPAKASADAYNLPIIFRNFALEIEAPMSEIDNNISNLPPDKVNEIILYQPDSTLSLDVRVENETVWLTQAQMTELFQTTRNNITLHIRNIFKEGELEESSVCKESLLTAADGKRYKTKF